MFYSKTTNSFYDEDVHGDRRPDDCVEISVERHQELLNGQTEGKIIASDDRGFPQLMNAPAPTPEEVLKANNAKFRQYLKDTDWYVIRKSEVGTPIPEDVIARRSEARLSVSE